MTVLLFNKFLKKRFYQLSLIGRAANPIRMKCCHALGLSLIHI